ncbi:hypothetical protein [Wenyingzhuangia sp. 2_MG-2023]|uniref:hypothetical protein n=1 Tax=Wenyingzhuangia sp. 2_MG-2023 TaxID=3062639 RepID=UPI0026E1DB8C|nr:hypothetical protein [Wenyingzhuangia sp. 2_MG-2023]MDO6738029.1 hypothetical protein [Wenyingzhuangia sp. 2_MG-2023]MDO6802617.1 hypothetical protein [Wenyingzhuangia sp. 1_MG-2023]
MKNFILILAIMAMGTANAQKKNELKGPEAKNYKPWQHKVAATVEVYSVDKSALRSKEVKNYKPWKKGKNVTTKKLVLASNYKRNELQGPAAKNYKPWRE